MSHNYLIETYDFIRQRLDEVQRQLTDANADQRTRHHAAGRVEALCDLERFLKENFHIKLPGRLRKSIQGATPVCTTEDTAS